MRAHLATIPLVAALFACGSPSEHPPTATGNVTNAPPVDTPTASGCPADAKRDCSIATGQHDGVSDCIVGSQLCLQGAWGDCGDATPFCTRNAMNAMMTLVASGSSAFVDEWNADASAISVGVEGLVSHGKSARLKLGGVGSAPVTIAPDGGPPVAVDLAAEPRLLVLQGTTSVAGASLRVHSKKLDVVLPTQTLTVAVHLDPACSAVQGVDVSVFVDAATVSTDQRALLGDPTDTYGTATGWSLTFTGSPAP